MSSVHCTSIFKGIDALPLTHLEDCVYANDFDWAETSLTVLAAGDDGGVR